MRPPEDQRLQEVLRALGVRPDALLGRGGEAGVYAVDDERVVRILHAGQDTNGIRSRQQLVAELGSRGAPFALPEVLDVGEVAGRAFSVERRLPGRPLTEALATLTGAARAELVEHHLEAAAALGSLHLGDRGWFGELLGERPLRSSTWTAYLHERATASLLRSTPDLRGIDAAALADALPGVDVPAFVHLDAFAGNMLSSGTTITAVLDIGVTSLAGDPRFDPVACAAYVSSPLITPGATSRDADVARSWLRAAGLLEMLEPVQRWLAAFWASAVDDVDLHRWCRSVLVDRA